ncbi:DUF2785 domain-containing protein [Undibacterium sp.]|jgi:hypothetical protein|uniref:DUF2785 domain-containing protein n=1 Tax=Undibacterium sp. TaxID=1914977 RepID=UPI002BC40A7D|nr:DUF2785 domain-containing protein [Undibacterium sp.]HTD06322.1 DUF2785 domain-containing protein [Undibacterium sp.]
MKKSCVAAVLVPMLLAGAHAFGNGAPCPPAGWSTEQLTALRAREFDIDDNAQRQQLALGLLPCLASPNPVLRDEIAFEAYSTWLRSGKLDDATRNKLYASLLPALVSTNADKEGFRAPFSALVMSELARVDRLTPYLTAANRQDLLEHAARYLQTQQDYRGFNQRQGWRHGIAHGADLLMQLSLNPALDKFQLDQILAAIAPQVAPAGGHFYIYGEAERLARPVLFIMGRKLYTEAEWDAWLMQISSPAPFRSWGDVFQSEAGLAKRHNTRAFLSALFVETRDSKEESLATLAPKIKSALATLQ